MRGVSTVKAIAVVLLVVLTGHPLAAMACEARCDHHGRTKERAGSEAGTTSDAASPTHDAHLHNHLARAVPDETAVVTSAAPAGGSAPSLTAASLCCPLAVAAPPDRFTLASRSGAYASETAALLPVSHHVVAAVTAASAAGLRRSLSAPIQSSLSVLRL